MDIHECETVIAAARGDQTVNSKHVLQNIDTASVEFRRRVQEMFGRQGEH
jgi:hypothetical protein